MNVGSIYSFVYHAGTNPGHIRKVYIQDEDTTHYLCWDFNVDNFRRFFKDKITNVGRVPGSFVVRNTDRLPEWFKNGVCSTANQHNWHSFEDEDSLVFCP